MGNTSHLRPGRRAGIAALVGAACVWLVCGCSLVVKTDDLSGGAGDAGAAMDAGTATDALTAADGGGSADAFAGDANPADAMPPADAGWPSDDAANHADTGTEDAASGDSFQEDTSPVTGDADRSAPDSGGADAAAPDAAKDASAPDEGALDAGGGGGDAFAPDAGGADSSVADAGPPIPLARGGWVASAFASLSSNPPAYAIDGPATTRWTPGLSQTAGQWFQVDMAAVQTFREIAIDAGGTWSADYLRGYQIVVSNDGTTWSSPIATGVGAAQVVTIDFAPVAARYVRVVLTAAVATSKWWSIAELNVLD